MSSSTHKSLRTEVFTQNHSSVVLPFILCIFGTLLFYILSPYIVSKNFLFHVPTLFFLWLTSKRNSGFSIAIAIAMGLTTEILLSLTIGAGVFIYCFSYGAIRAIEPLWDLHYRFHRVGYSIVFIVIWHILFWAMH